MSRTSAIHDAWHPQTRQDREAILLELQEVLASPHFCNSKRYPALLQYIVEKTLAGESDMLKERTLGVEVFDRSPSYDTNTDTVVRYTAGEVRKRLSLYYHELGRKPVIQISLPPGSYVPEFLHAEEEAEDPHDRASSSAGLMAHMDSGHALGAMLEPDSISPWALGDSGLRAGLEVEGHPGSAVRYAGSVGRRHRWLALAAIVAIAVLAGLGWKYRTAQPRTALDSFWAPVLRDQRVVAIYTGGSVFSQNHLSGVATAGKDIDYPFVSIQSASAIAQLSSMLERSGGVTTQLKSAASTPLTELRQHPMILLGGYNNPWTLRLVQPLRFHFWQDAAVESIVDDAQPGVRWERDRSLPYSGADDYALVARFRNPTTDSWVVALAGVGRNGTEAAAQFATDPHYMQLLRDQAGSDFSNKNVEVVLKVNVVDGKTGAPSILTWYVW
jgi:hypothetical protein